MGSNGLLWSARQAGGSAYVDWVYIAVVVAVHVAIREQAVGEE